MSLRVVRESKFRHVYGELAKKENYFTQIRPVFEGHRHHIAANSEFFVFSGQGGGGPVYVMNVNEPGRGVANPPKIMVHKGKVVDFAFSPFDNNLLATASEDAMVQISRIPEGGLKADTTKSEATLAGHGKKLALIGFHPTASNVLASAGFDNLVKLWDIETQTERVEFDNHKDAPYSLAFNSDGSMIATTCKDKKLRLFDPRSKGVAHETDGMGGTKTSEVLFCDNYGLLFVTGFNKGSMRQWAVYDPKMFNKPCKTEDIDASAGVICTYYDPDLSLVYLAGKGDGNIKYLEMTSEAPYAFALDSFVDNVSQKGFTMIPKPAMDVKRCEVARGLRLLGDSVQPLSFIVPRKTELFQADIFPDTYSYEATGSAEDYFGGKNPAPTMKSMNPKNAGAGAKAGGPRPSVSVNSAAASAASSPRPSVAEPAPARVSVAAASPAPAPAKVADNGLQAKLDAALAELAAANARIADLESQLASFQN